MAIIFLSDGGAGIGGTITAASIFSGPVSGTVSYQSTVKKHGIGALQHNSLASASAYINRLNCLADAGRRINLNVYFDGAGASAASGIIRALNGTATAFEIRFDNARKLRLYAGATGSTLVQTGATVLSLNTWYRLSFCYTMASTSVNEFRVYLDGNLELTGTNVASSVTGAQNLRIGWTGTSPGASISMYTSDFYIDDSNALTDPGNILVTNKRPAGLGATNNFDTAVGTGTNRWDRVNEFPANTANRYTHAATGQQSESYSVESASAGDDDLTGATLLGWACWVHYAVVAAAGSTLASMIANNGFVTITTTQGSGVYQTVEAIVASTSYPSGNNVIGLRSTGTTVDTMLAECGIFLAYTAAASTGGPIFFRKRQSRMTQIRM